MLENKSDVYRFNIIFRENVIFLGSAISLFYLKQ